MEWESLAAKTNLTNTNQIADEVIRQITSLANTFKKQTPSLLIINTLIASPGWPLHIIPDEKTALGRRVNRRLVEKFAEDPHIQIFDLDSLAAYHGYRRSLSPQMLHMARNPFSETFMPLLAQKITSHIKALKGMVRKCLVLDCDNTLWGGIIGEDGFDDIQLGPDSPGREFVDFQHAILELYHQGVVLALNSKNNHHDVIEVLHKHPHMVLREKHFAALEINWQDKPSNMRLIAQTLNIATDSFVFLDDNPAERAMMRQMLPEICTIEMPENPALYARTLRETNEFAKTFLTPEDRQRGQIYAAQRQREQLKTSVGSLEEFLKSLEMVATVRSARSSDIKRVAQLTQRTNQFNLTTRRYCEADIKAMLEAEDWYVYVLGLKDKFGDNGTVGVALVNQVENCRRIDTFLISCRVIGRGAEDALVHRILQDAAKQNITSILAEYLPTAKNRLVADFWERMYFNLDENLPNQTSWKYEIAKFHPHTFAYLKIIDE